MSTSYHPITRARTARRPKTKCSACGKLWVDHPGVAVTCAALQRMQTALKQALLILRNDAEARFDERACATRQRWIEELEVQAGLRPAPRRPNPHRE